MRGFSKAIITGNLTRDPELRTTPNGSNVCSFSVAVNRSYKDANGEQRENVSFIDCSAWNRLGELIHQYAKKGTGVLVSGRLDQRSFEGKDGIRRSRTEIVVEDFNFMGGGSGSGSSGSYGGNSGTSNFGAAGAINDTASDVPSDVPIIADDDENQEIDLSEVPF